ncbi:MAG: protein-glutamate O-methyltransferase CheR, partial [Verrucomicrobiota bacterium]
ICQLPDLEEYWRLVCDSKAELQELIEAVVVPETWFFRDRKAFTALGQIASDQWWPAHPEGVMRLLSLPCSTGEEPFSMAMALQEAGLPLNRFCIDAFDISGHALARARRAIYGKNSFRGDDLAFRERFFEPHEGGHRLCDTVRGQVRFQQGNLLHPDFLAGSERYDVIFCRNVLIYFDRPTQERAITLLTRLLSSEGVVFVGPSESGLLLSQKYVSAKIPLAFAFYKQPREAKAAVRLPSAPGVKRPAPVAVIRPPLPPLPPIRPVATAAAAPSKEPAEPLEEAGRLARDVLLPLNRN